MNVVNEDFFNFNTSELKLNVCDLSVSHPNSRLYINQHLQLIPKNSSSSRTGIAIGRLFYLDNNLVEKHIDIVAKFYFNMVYSPLAISVLGLDYEILNYRYITHYILSSNICPNFIGYIGSGVCDQNTVNQNIISLREMRHKYRSFINSETNVSILFTQKLGSKSLHEFIEIFPADAVIYEICFQILYILLVLEHFRIQHNDLHTVNIRVDTLRQKTKLCYKINDHNYVINTKYIIYIYDWDYSYNPNLGINGGITKYLENIFIYNDFIFKKDMSYIFNYILEDMHEIERTNFGLFRKYEDFLLDLEDYQPFSLLETILGNSYFNSYKISNTDASETFCFGNMVTFNNVYNPYQKFVISYSARRVLTSNETDARPIFINRNSLVLESCDEICFLHSPTVLFSDAYHFGNIRKFSLINYTITYEDVKTLIMLGVSKFHALEELVLCFTNIEINDIFSHFVKYRINNTLEVLDIRNNIAHTDIEDLYLIDRFSDKFRFLSINTIYEDQLKERYTQMIITNPKTLLRNTLQNRYLVHEEAKNITIPASIPLEIMVRYYIYVQDYKHLPVVSLYILGIYTTFLYYALYNDIVKKYKELHDTPLSDKADFYIFLAVATYVYEDIDFSFIFDKMVPKTEEEAKTKPEIDLKELNIFLYIFKIFMKNIDSSLFITPVDHIYYELYQNSTPEDLEKEDNDTYTVCSHSLSICIEVLQKNIYKEFDIRDIAGVSLYCTYHFKNLPIPESIAVFKDTYDLVRSKGYFA